MSGQSEQKWFYANGDDVEGPIAFDELQEKIEKGEIEHETLIWIDPANKKPASEIGRVAASNIDEPAPIPREQQGAEQKEEKKLNSKSHPWIRFFARILDYKIFLFVIGLILFAMGIEITPNQFAFLFIASIFVWIFIESFLLSTWGSTPGKWLLKVHLKKKSVGKPSYLEAIHRSFAVWWLGMGAGIFPITAITMIVANVKLSNLGQTTWDRMYGYEVEHEKLGAGRIILVIVLFVLLSYFFAYGIN